MSNPDVTGEVTLARAHPDFQVPAGMQRLVREVASREGLDIRELSIVFADHETVTGLNQIHLNRDYVTDVLAFDLREDPEHDSGMIEGEIYIDADTAQERAPEFGVSVADEIRRYVVHGLLHLAGYRDDDARSAQEIRELENLYLGLHINPETAR